MLVTYTFRFSTAGVEGKCKCSVCGKPIKKKFNFEYRSDLGTKQEDWDYVNAQKAEWESKEHVCTKCLRTACKQVANNVTEDVKIDLNKLETSYQEYQEYVKTKQQETSNVVESLIDKIKGKICYDNKNEYVINNVNYSLGRTEGLYIHAYQLDKIRPWTTIDKSVYFTFEEYYSNTKPVSILTFTDETLDSRKNLIKDL